MSGDASEHNRKRLTSRQLAALIGVSQSAVSRAFTPGSSISPAMRERILASARELGYQPNAIASMLSTNRTNIIGIVLSDMRNPFYPGLIERLTQGLQRVGRQSLLFNVTPGANIEEQLQAIRQYNVDGVIVVAATILSEKALSWAIEGRRSVLVNRLSLDRNITTVCVDNAAGVSAIADHFHALGRRKVGYVAGMTKTLIGRERRMAFVTRLAELGMTLVGSAAAGEYSYAGGHRAAQELLAEGSRPDAIFFANDILALGGMDALRDVAGLCVPDDVAIAGFDDIAMSAWPHYELTTFAQPVSDIVERSVELICNAPLGDGDARQEILSGRLIVRRSTVGAGGGPVDGDPRQSVKVA